MKKLISLCLAALLFALLLAPASAAVTGGALNAPTVYVVGGNANVINGEGEQVLSINVPDGYLGEAIADCVPDLAKAVLLRTPEAKAAYIDKLVSWMAPIYEKVIMDDNGEPIGEYYPLTDYDRTPFVIPEVAPNRISNGGYALRSYDFYYDWRLDPFVNAARLEAYITAIQRGTGAEKVNLLGRCEGATVVMAYLSAYGHEKINKVFFNTSAAKGYLLTSAIFSGQMEFSSKVINAYLNNNPNFSLDTLDTSSIPAGEELIAMLTAMLDGAAAAPEMDIPAWLLSRLYADIIRDAVPQVLLASYGTFPAMWAMVDNDHFEAAVSYVFAGKEAQYAGLIEKIRNYHENVAQKIDEILTACMEDGVAVGGVTKYGYPAMPLYKDSDQLSDGHALVSQVSFGATAAKHDGVLDEKYINRRVSDGLGKYISADKKIDASTCLFPDTMWFVGNLEHQSFPWMLDDLTQRFFTTDGMTVDTLAAYPQFMLFNAGAYRFEPLTEENAALSVVGVEKEEESVVDAFDRFMSGFLTIVLRVVEYVRGIISGIVEHATA